MMSLQSIYHLGLLGTVLGEYRPLVFFCTDLAALGPYCQDLEPIFSQYGPRAWLIRYICGLYRYVPQREWFFSRFGHK